MVEDLEVLERKEIVTLEKWEQQQNQFYANISYIGVNLHEHMEQVHIILHNMYTDITYPAVIFRVGEHEVKSRIHVSHFHSCPVNEYIHK